MSTTTETERPTYANTVDLWKADEEAHRLTIQHWHAKGVARQTDRLSKMTVAELRNIATSHNRNRSGTKAELIEDLAPREANAPGLRLGGLIEARQAESRIERRRMLRYAIQSADHNLDLNVSEAEKWREAGNHRRHAEHVTKVVYRAKVAAVWRELGDEIARLAHESGDPATFEVTGLHVARWVLRRQAQYDGGRNLDRSGSDAIEAEAVVHTLIDITDRLVDLNELNKGSICG